LSPLQLRSPAQPTASTPATASQTHKGIPPRNSPSTTNHPPPPSSPLTQSTQTMSTSPATSATSLSATSLALSPLLHPPVRLSIYAALSSRLHSSRAAFELSSPCPDIVTSTSGLLSTSSISSTP